MPGDAIIYDPRIMHRGRANVGKIDRPMLHNSYCHIWYKDEDNQRGDGIYMKNLRKLGRIPLHIVKDFNEYNMDVVEKLLEYHPAHLLFAITQNELFYSNHKSNP